MEQPRRKEATDHEQEAHHPRRRAALALGGGYKFVLAKPAKAEPKPKVHGTVYVLQKEFLVNLADGRYAKLHVGLVLVEDHVAAAAGGHGAPTPPEGYGAMPQEASSATSSPTR